MSKQSKPLAVYLRVSTEDQDHASQRAEVERWIAKNGIDPSKVEWYADVETGRTMDRPDFKRLEKDVDAGKRTTVIVYKLDRLSRDMLDGMELVGRWCRAGVRVASVTQSIDLTGTVGKVIAAVLFGFAEIEWTDRKERQAAGIAVARANGVYRGREPGSTKRVPDRARELRDKGLEAPEIARAMGISRRTVFRYLRLSDPSIDEPKTAAVG